jgi:Ca-activated chloride channel family protein
MPGRGDRVDRAIDEARTLLERAGAIRGRIVLLIDGVGERPDLTRSAAERAADAGTPVSVLGIGGDAAGMRALAESGGGRFAPMTADDRDLDVVLADASGPKLGATAVASDLTADAWRDMGVWLVLVPLFLAPFAFRKGWAAALALPLVGGVGLAAPEAEAGIADWWLRSDQQAARAFEEGEHARAAELFENEEWRGAAQYRAGDYAGAIESLGDADDPEAQYNLGNALAHSQQLEQAIAAYDRVLEAEPDHADALHNKELVEKLLEQQQEQQQQQQPQDPQGDSEDPSQQSESQDGQQPDESQQDQGEEEQAGQEGEDSSNDPSEQAGRGADDPDPEADTAEDQASAGAEGDEEDAQERADSGGAAEEDLQSDPREQAQSEPRDTQPADVEPQGNPQPGSASRREYIERDQEMEQRLNRVPDDPGGLLREKLRRRYLERRYGQAGGLR